jgi:hypothetical protein
MLCDPLRAHAPPEQRRYLTRLTHARVVACRSVATLTAESAVRLLRRTRLSGGAAAAAAETTSSRDGKRSAEGGGTLSVRFCFQCCGLGDSVRVRSRGML